MAIRAVHQLLPALLPGDAVGSHALEVGRAMRHMGLESEIFCEAVHHQMQGQGRPVAELPAPDAETILMYHFATGSMLADVAHARPEPLVVDYHNVTPAAHFRAWDRDVAAAVGLAREQLCFLATRAALGLGDSSFNRAELVEVGYRPTAVVPILIDPARLGAEPDPATLDRLRAAKRGGSADWLFVSRLAPNKAQHDVVKALAAYRAVYDPQARLHLVGRPDIAAYARALRRFVASAGLEDAVELADQGVSPAALAAYYASADVLVSCSEHEGFGVWLLEAMHHRLPVVALAAAAVPETLGEAGLLLADKAPLSVAAAVHRVLDDTSLRERLTTAGTARLAELSLERSRERLVTALSPLTGRAYPAAVPA